MIRTALGIGLILGLPLGFFVGRWTAPVPIAPVEPESAAPSIAIRPEDPKPVAIPDARPPVAAADPAPAASPQIPEGIEQDTGSARTPTANTSPSESAAQESSGAPGGWRERVEKARVENLFDSLRGSKPITAMPEELAQLNGRFVGEVRFRKGQPDRIWEMTMEARLRIENGRLRGDTRILLSKNGQVFSDLSGNGNQDDYRYLGADQGLVVKVSPDAYIQIFYVPRLDAFTGTFYRQEGLDKITPRGTVRLERS